jgi:hypothetical protein
LLLSFNVAETNTSILSEPAAISVEIPVNSIEFVLTLAVKVLPPIFKVAVSTTLFKFSPFKLLLAANFKLKSLIVTESASPTEILPLYKTVSTPLPITKFLSITLTLDKVILAVCISIFLLSKAVEDNIVDKAGVDVDV